MAATTNQSLSTQKKSLQLTQNYKYWSRVQVVVAESHLQYLLRDVAVAAILNSFSVGGVMDDEHLFQE